MENSNAIRLVVCLASLLAMGAWESLAPRRTLVVSRTMRVTNNLLLSLVNTMLVRFVPVCSAVAAAAVAEQYGWGLLNWLELPVSLELVAAVVALDLLVYGQHVAMHRVSWLWLMHRVHHADLDVDASTGLRFHPLEIGLSMMLKVAAAIALGASPMAVVVFEIVLNGSSIFNHGNVRIPKVADRLLRLFLVTPDMHRVHHSVVREETDSNFGFALPWWDRLFGTYRPQPSGDHHNLELGLPEMRAANETVSVVKMIAMPFRKL